MEANLDMIHQDLMRMQKELELIKKVIFYEGNLTPWAKKALQAARKEKEEKYTSLDEL